MLVIATGFTIPSPVGARTAAEAGPPAPVGPPGPWRLAFDDEFDGTSLDTARWSTCYLWGCTNFGNGELEWYRPANVSVSGGVLHLTARRQADPSPADHGRSYTSGMIQTWGRYGFLYGYVEWRARFPSGRGLWPSLWSMPADLTWPPEIDVAENWGQPLDTVAMTVHYGADEQASEDFTGPDFAAGYHTFGVDWEPSGLTWYVDGVARAHVAIAIRRPQFLLADLAVNASPRPDASTRLPASLSIDWVRVWQHGPPQPAAVSWAPPSKSNRTRSAALRTP